MVPDESKNVRMEIRALERELDESERSLLRHGSIWRTGKEFRPSGWAGLDLTGIDESADQKPFNHGECDGEPGLRIRKSREKQG